MTRVQRFEKTTGPGSTLAVDNIGPVHEKCKKAGVHAVSFGLATEPFATFRPRYRPIELLRANGIALQLPRLLKGKKRSSEEPEVKPEPAVDEEDEDEDNDEADRIAFLREQVVSMQRQLDAAISARRSKRTIVKWEPCPNRVPDAGSLEVIDLT
ncbi:hypothetical protein BD413DRAFT_612286 [Trametes elegans]|nr:hypothetical protein BD413DRAFT_612286 [Trametes elegans]